MVQIRQEGKTINTSSPVTSELVLDSHYPAALPPAPFISNEIFSGSFGVPMWHSHDNAWVGRSIRNKELLQIYRMDTSNNN